jgi:hypothetical protein
VRGRLALLRRLEIARQTIGEQNLKASMQRQELQVVELEFEMEIIFLIF